MVNNQWKDWQIKQKFHRKESSNGLYTDEKMPTLISNQRNANQNNNETQFHTYQIGKKCFKNWTI